MKVRIIEKIYHHTKRPKLSTPYRTDRELFWIKELGTAMPYGCNDNIKGVENLSSPGCSEINVMSLFNTNPRRTFPSHLKPLKTKKQDLPQWRYRSFGQAQKQKNTYYHKNEYTLPYR
jgi:hypothetical protein